MSHSGIGAMRLRARISLLYFATFLHLGLMSPFLPLWFSHRGLSSGWIACLLALPLLLRPVAAPIVAWAGRRGQVRNGIAACASGALLVIASTRWVGDPTLLAVIFVLFAFVWEPLPILVDTFALMATRARSLSFGRLRAWGSSAFLITTVAGGALLDAVGIEAVPLMIAGLLVLPLAMSALLPSDREWIAADPVQVRMGASLLHDRTLIAAGVATALIVSSQGVLLAFSSLGWSQSGVSSTTIGQLWAVGLASEMLVLWFAEDVLGRRDPALLLVAGGLASVLRWLLMATGPGVALSFVLQAMQGVSAMAPILALTLLLARRVPMAELGLFQAAATTAIGLTQALVIIAGGVLWRHGAATAYGAMATIAGLGIVVALASALLHTRERLSGTGRNAKRPCADVRHEAGQEQARPDDDGEVRQELGGLEGSHQAPTAYGHQPGDHRERQ